MTISFDLDDTLCSNFGEFEMEQYTILNRILWAEKTRKGTTYLFHELEKQGIKIVIYTTSLRTVFYMKRTFLSYGLKPSRFINERLNRKILDEHKCYCSKNPRLHGIDLHVDDSKGVELEGLHNHFKVLQIAPSDEDWTNKILIRLNELKKECGIYISLYIILQSILF